MKTYQQHEFPPNPKDEDKCIHCGLSAQQISGKSCNLREPPPRKAPVFLADNPASIYDRMLELRAERAKGLIGAAESA